MSILIDMEMPTSCYDCNLAYQDQDSEHNIYWICAIVHKSACMYKRRDDCPLISIPPHGRLIDADALTISIAVPLDGKPYQYVHIDNIKDASTIIPADKSDMDSFIHIFEEDDEEDKMDSFIQILKD